MTLERALFIARRISIGLVIIGILFKIQHFPYTGILLAISFILLSLNHLVLAFAIKLSDNYSPLMKGLFKASCILLAIALFQYLFGISHYLYADEMRFFSAMAFLPGIIGYFHEPAEGKINPTYKRIHIAAMILGGLNIYSIAVSFLI